MPEAKPPVVNEDHDVPPVQTPLQTYRCLKLVQAGKIREIRGHRHGAVLFFEEQDADGQPLQQQVTRAYVAKHDPKAGGYYVRYADSYESWSPASAFESGYMVVQAEKR